MVDLDRTATVDLRPTTYGFDYGAAQVTWITEHKGQVCIEIRTTTGKCVQVWVSKTGRSLRVFSKDGEWKVFHEQSS